MFYLFEGLFVYTATSILRVRMCPIINQYNSIKKMISCISVQSIPVLLSTPSPFFYPPVIGKPL